MEYVGRRHVPSREGPVWRPRDLDGDRAQTMAERSQPSAGQESHEGTVDRASQGEPTTEVVNAEDVIH